MQPQNCKNLTVLLRNNDIRDNILPFMNQKELVQIRLTCRKLNKIVIEYKRNNSFSNFGEWKFLVLHKLKKIRSLKICKPLNEEADGAMQRIKMSLYDFPKELLKPELWVFVNQCDKQLQCNGVMIQEKFTKEQNNFFFQNILTKDILFMNRSLLDMSLNINQPKPQERGEEFKNDNIYKHFYQDNQFAVENYDFTNMQSLLSRQKQIMKKMEQDSEQLAENQKIENCLQDVLSLQRITIILCCGGYFSIGIFVKNVCVFHKSDHKYVTRKKAGQRQLNKDKNTGQSIKSMGSQIRRDQEKKHQEKVSNILNESFSELEKSDLILLQAPGLNKLILINENEPLGKLKSKIRSICLTSKKANYTEVEKIYKSITQLNFLVFNNQDHSKVQ